MQVVKGMRDFYPEDYRLREWLFNTFIEASKNAGFEFYDAPILEYEELYIRKSGEEITDQLYSLSDKSERKLALRPEATPSLARLVISRFRQLPSRLKWATIAQCFRYERMTRGRKREHYQWNLDILGDESAFAEFEVLSTAINAIEKLGLTSNEIKLRISNRNLLADVLSGLGVDKSLHLAIFLQIDKLGKIPDSELIKALIALGIADTKAKKILEVIYLNSLDQVESLINALNAPKTGLEQIKEVFELLKVGGYKDWLTFDFSIVRGLAYYTGTVFEFFDVNKGLRAICGGGRYDQLIENLANAELSKKAQGSIKKSAIGFGFGDVVILELLADLNKLPKLNPQINFYLAPFTEAERLTLLPLLKALLKAGFSAVMSPTFSGPKKLLERALELGAEHCILQGENERLNQQIKIKTLATREEELVSISDFLNSLAVK